MGNPYKNINYEDYVVHANAYIGAIRAGAHNFDATSIELYASWLKELNEALPEFVERYMNGE